jgi:hypothetical protein
MNGNRLSAVVARWMAILLLAMFLRSRAALAEPAEQADVALIAPPHSLATGLLLEPPLDLSHVTRDKFVEMVSTVGRDKIGKPWTSPVTPLPAHARSDAQGLTHEEIKSYMVQVKTLFDDGKSVPMSDMGLVSTQEDVIRQLMLNHIAAFSNDAVRVYLLVQRTASDLGWSYFSIVQDMTLDPPLDYFAEIKPSGVRFEGANCYKCHSSGPLAIHPAGEEYVLDAKLAAALGKFIAEQPRSRFYFPPEDPAGEYGEPLKLDFCASCHAEDGERAPLYRVHAYPIRIMVDFGYMPPDRKLDANEIAELKAWLEGKSSNAR